MMKKLVININTGETGINEFVTEKITGKLDTLYVFSSKPSTLHMTREKYKDLPILNDAMLKMGSNHLPLRIEAVSGTKDKTIERFNFTNIQYCLDDSLHLTVSGEKHTTIDIEVYYDA